MNTFLDLCIDEKLIAGLSIRSISKPTPVQSLVIPLLLADENVLFQSETGTGKTFCYLLPAFMKCLTSDKSHTTQILVIAPTHELASQIKSEAVILARDSDVDITAALCIGGAPLTRQIDMLKEKPSILVGGPARILELIKMKKFKTHGISMVILDETDRMLAPEMRDIIRELLEILPADAQYVACSATLSNHHASILENMIPERKAIPSEGTAIIPEEVPAGQKKYKIKMVNLPPEDVLKRNIIHWAFYSEGRDKIDTLRSFLIAEKPEKALVFTAIAGQVENIVAQLNFKKVPSSGIYAKLDKVERKKAIDDFRAGRSKVLVTSDLAARGLDIPNITHVIQLDVNENEDFFIHRAGRTARAGKSGINAIFGDERELRNLSRVEKKLGIVIYPKILYGGAVRTPEQEEVEGPMPLEKPERPFR
jgi:ATP-dependent RNA helicase DeaD